MGGRARALAELDRVLARPRNLRTLREELQAAFTAAPLDFWSRYVVPLVPREALTLDPPEAEGPGDWRSAPLVRKIVVDDARQLSEGDKLALELQRPPLPPCHRRKPPAE